MSPDFTLPQLDERVLSTLNCDGSRRWLSPREVRGSFWTSRFVVAWSLIVVFTVLPWFRIAGKPPLLLDVMLRQFTFFGTTFRPTETLLLALLILSIFVAVFLLTAIYGRVWCGWACPQTVYLEFVYRPIERFFLGAGFGKPKQAVAPWRRVTMYAVFLLLSAHLANTFLAYFVGTDRLIGWTLRSPADHPVAFGIFAATVAMMMFDFVFFREQLCTIVCPYGRFQSVLLDRDSLVIGYNKERGEPRSRVAARRELESAGAPVGDCVECMKCVQVCPTGIDIREGLQLECVNCAQCVDACDEVMGKIGKPKGLIRYSTQNLFEGVKQKGPRFRVAIYPAILAVLLAAFVTLLIRREPALIEQTRLAGSNFKATLSGEIATPIRLLIENHTHLSQRYSVSGIGDVSVLGDIPNVTVEASEAGSIDITVLCPAHSFGRGSRLGDIFVHDEHGFGKVVHLTIAGPFSIKQSAGHAKEVSGESRNHEAKERRHK